ncbi:MAG: rod shape-determining protein MreC [Candidatus Omnitrophica bacterium]|nr:rod shape-determining protein MreC [Candidatus Omnitrophota bacterium]
MFGNRRNNSTLIIIACLTILFFLFRSNFFDALKFSTIDGIKGPIRVLAWPVLEVRKLILFHQSYSENGRLRKANEILKAQLAGIDDVVAENQRLSQMLALKRKNVFSSVAASVIGRDPSYWNSILVIDKGSADGVKMGQAVISPAGVVGKVTEVGRNSSKVVLITDPDFSVAAVIEDSRESGLVSGTLQGLSRMKYLRKDAVISVGSRVVTSKISSSFPENLLIGEVIQVLPTADGDSMECTVKPQIDLSRLEEVLVVGE